MGFGEVTPSSRILPNIVDFWSLVHLLEMAEFAKHPSRGRGMSDINRAYSFNLCVCILIDKSASSSSSLTDIVTVSPCSQKQPTLPIQPTLDVGRGVVTVG